MFLSVLSLLIATTQSSSPFEALKSNFDTDQVKLLRSYQAANGDFTKIEKQMSEMLKKFDTIYIPKALSSSVKSNSAAERTEALIFAMKVSSMLDPSKSNKNSVISSWKYMIEHKNMYKPFDNTVKRAALVLRGNPDLPQLLVPFLQGKYGKLVQAAVSYADALNVGGPNAGQDSSQKLSKVISNFPNTPYANEAKSAIQKRKQLVSGREAPNLAFRDTSGQKISIHELKGKVILFDFWGFWCPGCVQELGELKAIRSQYPADKLVMISVSTDGWPTKYFDERVREAGLLWQHVLLDSPSNETLTQLGVFVYPAKLLIDSSGKVVLFGSNFELSDWKQKLSKLF